VFDANPLLPSRDPTELYFDTPAPFHDTVKAGDNIDVIGLGAWYCREDH
jgi:hypothetical protein